MSSIDIIIPVYNVELYLRECLDSILNQSFRDYKIILVDDASTDSSGIICDEYKNKFNNIKVIHRKINIGPSCRNDGIRISESPYITFVDSDDFLLPNALKLLHDEAIKGFDIVMGGTIETDENKNIIRKVCLQDDFEGFGEKAILKSFTILFAGVVSRIYKRELFLNNRIKNLHIGEDCEVSARLMYASNNIKIIKNPVYVYRKRKNSLTTSQFSINSFSEILSHLECLKFYKSIKYFKCIPNEISCLYNVFLKINIIISINKDNKEYKKLFKKYLKEFYRYINFKQKLKLKFFLFFKFSKPRIKQN